MAAGWTVPQIIAKVRNITGTPSSDQLTDDQILDYINNYYVYTMPFELKEQIQLKYYDFTTVPLQDQYSMPVDFLTNQPICWADGIFVNYYEDPNIFFKDWPQQYNQDSVGTGTGINTIPNGATQASPIIGGTFFITDGTATNTMSDTVNSPFDGTGSLANSSGSGSGTINYGTGAYTGVTFPNVIVSGATIYDKYQAMVQTRPQGVLFFNNVLTFRPVPDQVYQIRLQGYINPNQLTISPVTSPTLIEWGQVIAYGASMDIYADRGDSDGQATAYANLKRFENVALGRYVQQMQSQRPSPRF